MEVRFSKWFQKVEKGVMNLFFCKTMAYNMISCQKFAKDTQILKIADFTMQCGLLSSEMTQNSPKTGPSIAIYSNFCIGTAYIEWYLVNPQNKYGKGGFRVSKSIYGQPRLTLISRGGNYLNGIQNLPSIGSYSKKMYYFLILLANRVLAASPNFGLEKYGQKARQPLFVHKAGFDPLSQIEVILIFVA